jgi:hypothetical protein
MTPSYLAGLAERLHPKRLVFAMASLSGFLVLLAVGHFMPRALPVVVPLAGPLVLLPWVVFCACTWFHPKRGSLRLRAGSRAVVIVREGMRWYAAVFIGLSVVIAVLVWPILAIQWL